MVGENPLQAFADATGVGLRSLRRQARPLARFPARVSDPRRGPSDDGEDVVSSVTEMEQRD